MIRCKVSAAEGLWKCGAAVGLTESNLSEWTHSSDTASELHKIHQASSGKPPSPDESAAKTKEEKTRKSMLNF